MSVCFTFSVGLGQNLPLPQADQNPSAEGSPSPVPSVPPPILLPEELLRPAPNDPALTAELPSIPQLDEGLKPAPLSPAALEYQHKIDARKLRNRVQNDPAIKRLLTRAEAAPNDLEKRQRLTNYYQVFYGRMIALAETPQLKTYLTARRNESLAVLKQPRVRPEPSPVVRGTRPSAKAPTESNALAQSASSSPSPSPPPVRSTLFPSTLGSPRPAHP